MNSEIRRLVVIAATCTVTLNASAWWDQSHLFITELATVASDSSYKNFMTYKTQQKVESLLKVTIDSPGSETLSRNTNSLPTASIWADSIKHFADEKNNYSACHYIAVPIRYLNEQISSDTAKARVVSYDKNHKEELNSINCLKMAVKTLKANKTSNEAKALALRIALHTMGDMANPIHNANFEGQAGQNFVLDSSFKVIFSDGSVTLAKNLHQVWDSGLGMYAQFPFYESKAKEGTFLDSEINYVKEQVRILANLRDYRELPVNRSSETEESFINWVAESHYYAQNKVFNNLYVYKDYDGIYHVQNLYKDSSYARSGVETAASQLYGGGVRTAKLLTAIFDPSSADPGYVKMVSNITRDSSIKTFPR